MYCSGDFYRQSYRKAQRRASPGGNGDTSVEDVSSYGEDDGAAAEFGRRERQSRLPIVGETINIETRGWRRWCGRVDNSSRTRS